MWLTEPVFLRARHHSFLPNCEQEEPYVFEPIFFAILHVFEIDFLQYFFQFSTQLLIDRKSVV